MHYSSGAARLGRAAGRGREAWRAWQRRDPVLADNGRPPQGELMEVTTSDRLSKHPAFPLSATPTIRSCQYVSSFSWLRYKSRTVVIPGMPPEWAPLDVARKLAEDPGSRFRDTNAAHFPRHPLEPAVRAVFAQAPKLARHDIDVFACRSTMGNLLHFALGNNNPFQFVVETIGNTVFFARRENSPDERIEGIVGFGQSFADLYTRLHESVQKAESHQRMIKYDFGGLQCIVRFECDGYLPEKVKSSLSMPEIRPLPQLERLELRPGGNVVPQEAIFDLKTRSLRKQLTIENVLSEKLPGLWLRQIPNFVLAYHTDGVFEVDDVEVHDIRGQMHAWEVRHQDEVKVFSAVLAKIIDFARSDPGRRFEVCSSVPGTLEFRHVGGDFANALPDDVTRLWALESDYQSGS